MKTLSLLTPILTMFFLVSSQTGATETDLYSQAEVRLDSLDWLPQKRIQEVQEYIDSNRGLNRNSKLLRKSLALLFVCDPYCILDGVIWQARKNQSESFSLGIHWRESRPSRLSRSELIFRDSSLFFLLNQQISEDPGLRSLLLGQDSVTGGDGGSKKIIREVLDGIQLPLQSSEMSLSLQLNIWLKQWSSRASTGIQSGLSSTTGLLLGPQISLVSGDLWSKMRQGLKLEGRGSYGRTLFMSLPDSGLGVQETALVAEGLAHFRWNENWVLAGTLGYRLFSRGVGTPSIEAFSTQRSLLSYGLELNYRWLSFQASLPFSSQVKDESNFRGEPLLESWVEIRGRACPLSFQWSGFLFFPCAEGSYSVSKVTASGNPDVPLLSDPSEVTYREGYFGLSLVGRMSNGPLSGLPRENSK